MATPDPFVGRRITPHHGGLPDECDNCEQPIQYWQDPEGTWRECPCDAGYLLDLGSL